MHTVLKKLTLTLTLMLTLGHGLLLVAGTVAGVANWVRVMISVITALICKYKFPIDPI